MSPGQWEYWLAEILLGPALGTLAGAWFAFRLERGRREHERVIGEISAANAALFEISNQLKEIDGYLKITDGYKQHPRRWLDTPIMPPSPLSPAVEIGRLTFFLDRGEAPVLDSTINGQLLVFHVRDLLRQRVPAMDAVNEYLAPHFGQPVDDNLLTEIIPPQLYQKLRALDGELFEMMPQAKQHLHEDTSRLMGALQRHVDRFKKRGLRGRFAAAWYDLTR